MLKQQPEVTQYDDWHQRTPAPTPILRLLMKWQRFPRNTLAGMVKVGNSGYSRGSRIQYTTPEASKPSYQKPQGSAATNTTATPPNWISPLMSPQLCRDLSVPWQCLWILAGYSNVIPVNSLDSAWPSWSSRSGLSNGLPVSSNIADTETGRISNFSFRTVGEFSLRSRPSLADSSKKSCALLGKKPKRLCR